jgi:hypothetical protein
MTSVTSDTIGQVLIGILIAVKWWLDHRKNNVRDAKTAAIDVKTESIAAGVDEVKRVVNGDRSHLLNAVAVLTQDKAEKSGSPADAIAAAQAKIAVEDHQAGIIAQQPK